MGGEDDELKGLLGLPEEETELDVILSSLSLGFLLLQCGAVRPSLK